MLGRGKSLQPQEELRRHFSYNPLHAPANPS